MLSDTKDQRKLVFTSITKELNIAAKLPDLDNDDFYIIPTPQLDEELVYEQEEEALKNSWKFFDLVVSGVDEDSQRFKELFKKCLALEGFGVEALTRILYLISPEKFYPIDETYRLLFDRTPGLLKFEVAIKSIEKEGLPAYLTIQKQIKTNFSGCEFYEINFLFSLLTKKKLEISENYYQVGTNVYNNNDHWETFKAAYYSLHRSSKYLSIE